MRVLRIDRQPCKRQRGLETTHGIAYSVAMHTTFSASRLFHLALLPAGLVLCAGASAQLPPPRIQPDSGPWDSGAGFHFDLDKNHLQKTRQSVSGIACSLNARQRRICLMAFDEGTQRRYAQVCDKVLTGTGRNRCGLQAAGAVGRPVRRRAAGLYTGALKKAASTG